MDSRKKNINTYGRVMSRVISRSRSSLRSAPSVTRHDVPSSVSVGAKPSVSVSAVSSGGFPELPTVLNDFVPDDEREKVLRKRPIRRRRTLKSLDPGKTKSLQTSRDRGIEYSRSVRARGSAPTVLDSNGEEWSEAHVRQCHSSRSHTKLQELKDEIKAFRETDKLLRLRSHLYKSCGVVLDDVGRVARDQAVQADPVDKDITSLRRLQWLNLIGRGDLISRDTRNVVCQIHFKDEDINKNNSFRKSLQKNALPCFHLPSLLNEDKLTQTDIATFNSSSQTDMSNVLNIVPEIVLKKESTTTATQTEISVKSANETQTPISLSADTPRKRKLKSELKECKKRLKVLNAGQTTVATSSQKNTFEKLCNRFLSKNLTELVKAQMRLKSSRKGNRYTLAYKMFCLNLYYASPQAYHLLAKSICLPSRPTLNRMYIPISTEVNDDLMAALKLRVNNMSEKEKQCTLVADAMSLKTNLFYDIKHDKIIGFDEVDCVQSPSPAKHALVILVQGIYEKWSQPIGFALLSECKSDNNISKWVDKIIDKLFEIGLKIRAFVSDLGSDLLNAAHKRGISIDKTHFTVNDHKIYYIFDAPHLIKLIRNHLMSYDFHFHNGAVAKFEHIAKFYEFDQKKTFKQAYKLTNSHINPNGCEKMKVRYATQLLSRSVASGLSTCIDFEVIDESARHTVEFVIMMNDLFDALNSSTMSHCYSHKNAFCGYDQQIDFFNKMLTFFQELKIMNSKKASDVTKTAKFIQGFQITIKSILHLYEDLNQEGYRYLMTRRLNKDVIDFFFR